MVSEQKEGNQTHLKDPNGGYCEVAIDNQREWVLTHYYQLSRGGLPRTVIFLWDKNRLKEETFEVIGHLKVNQIVEIFGCKYIKPE